jgi:thiol-disulfide isomerase/thioredoxin
MLLAAMLSAVVTLPLSASAAPGDEVRLTLVPKSGMREIGFYAPQRAQLSDTKPDGLKAPAELASPRYGTLGGAKGIAFILDEPEGQPAAFYVDANRNGDLTDDPKPEWKGNTNPKTNSTMYSGSAMVDIGEAGKPLMVNFSMYRFDPKDPARAALKDVVLYYRDYAYKGEVTLGGQKYPAILSDELAAGDFRGRKPEAKPGEEKSSASGVVLMLDRNHDGKFDARRESFDIAKPFNIGGTTWEIAGMARDGSVFQIVKSTQTVAEIPPPPDHRVGKKATPFEAKDTAGKAVHFPSGYKGKVVLIDFWATWCGPCMQEMPNVVKAYEAHHKDGFEILGVSLDNEQSIGRMPEVMKTAGMTWDQVADGKFWQAEIAQMYAVESIPASYLVDGDTGEILGAGLRGDALQEAVAKAIEGKKNK